MATQNVLIEAINKLVKANANLQTKIKQETNKTKIEDWKKEMVKNQSMILDYKFRLEHE